MKGEIILRAEPTEHGSSLSGEATLEAKGVDIILLTRLFFETLEIDPDSYVMIAAAAQHPDRYVKNYQKISIDKDALGRG